MKRSILFAMASLVLSGLLLSCQHKPLRVCAGNYNIRVYTDYDSLYKHWTQRKEKVYEMIRTMEVCGLEEVTDLQVPDLIAALPEYSYVGYGRDNGLAQGDGAKGEQTALVFRNSSFELLAQGRFFLSETPAQVSKLDSAAYTRLVTWVYLRSKVNPDKSFYFFSTHFDHPITPTGIATRAHQAAIAAEWVRRIADTKPLLFVGDFNCEPSEPAYKVIASHWNDAFKVAHTSLSHGYEPLDSAGVPQYQGLGYTYTGLYNTAHDPYPKRIDYVFASESCELVSYEAVSDQLGYPTFPSDHLPVRVLVDF